MRMIIHREDFSFHLLVLLLCFSVFLAEDCACRFQASDPPDCKVYGQLGDGVLIPWHRASQGCLDTFNIKDQAIDPFTLKRMFPNGGIGHPNVQALVSYLRFNDGVVATGIKKSLADIFQEDPATQRAVFKDEIVVDGQTVSCAASARKCWNALRDYFNEPENQDLLQDISHTLYSLQALSLEKEQAAVRIRLCREGPTLECSALSQQVQHYVKKFGDTKYCSAYGLGPGNADLPYCSSVTGSRDNSYFGAFNIAGYMVIGGPYLLRMLQSHLVNWNLLG